MISALTLAAVLSLVVALHGPARTDERFPGAVAAIPAQAWGDAGDDRLADPRPRWRGGDEGALTERDVARRLVRDGFVRIEEIDRRRDRYVVRAVRPNGALIRVSVDAYDGAILARERLGWMAGGSDGDREWRRPAGGPEIDIGNQSLGLYAR